MRGGDRNPKKTSFYMQKPTATDTASMAPRAPPLVTGVSPKQGPPGTRITIRGENLGNDPRDLIGMCVFIHILIV